ncbi:MAG: potassium-transporting ATPase subunit KdpA [Nitrososphaeraceae archaeon]
MDTTIQLAVIIVGALGMSIPFGLYIARMISFELRPLERGLAKVERGFFKLIEIDADRQMTWKEYFLALFMTSIISIIFVILVLSFQNIYDYQSMSTDYPQIWHLILPCQLSQIPW